MIRASFRRFDRSMRGSLATHNPRIASLPAPAVPRGSSRWRLALERDFRAAVTQELPSAPRIGADPRIACVQKRDPVTPPSSVDLLRDRVHSLVQRAHVPFSDSPVAAVLLLEDGTWIPGVRIESASYSLTLPALVNAFTTAVALDRGADVVAAILSRPFRPEENLYMSELPYHQFDESFSDAWVRNDQSAEDLPAPTEPLSPFYDGSISNEVQGLEEVRSLFERAHVPDSHFPVGALIELDNGRLIPGVNVEHPDWARTLCAERNALGTVHSYDAGTVRRLYLSCATDPDGTPCGACRQLLAELAPESVLWMDRHDRPPEEADLSTLLPGSFRGRALLNSR